MDADPNLQTRSVDLVGTAEQISKAEQLINDVLAEVYNFLYWYGTSHVIMKLFIFLVLLLL